MADIGTLGELEVMEYLSKVKGCSVYVPLVDRGIDLIAVARKSFYQIQVKTSKFQRASYFWFDLHERKMVYTRNTYYIFVCKIPGRHKLMGKKSNFIVVPSLKIRGWIAQGAIARKQSDREIFNIFIYPDDAKRTWTYKNKKRNIDFTPYWNRFEPIK